MAMPVFGNDTNNMDDVNFNERLVFNPSKSRKDIIKKKEFCFCQILLCWSNSTE